MSNVSAMKNLLLVLSVVHLLGVSYAQDCSTMQATEEEFARYMQCIKDELTSNYTAYEKEVRVQVRQAVKECFTPNGCTLSTSEMRTKAWDPNGSLKDCPLCAKFLGSVISTTLFMPSKDQQCIREEIGKAMRRESVGCLLSRNIEFNIPQIPDLEEQSSHFADNVISAISDNVHIRNHLYSCRHENKSSFVKTKKCLRHPFPDFFPTHCKALQRCDDRIPAACKPGMAVAKRTMCTCIRNSREDILKRFWSMGKVIDKLVGKHPIGPAFGAGSEADNCVRAIKNKMTTSSNEWFAVIDASLAKCIRNGPSQGFLTMDNIIHLGCRSVLKERSDKAKKELGRAFAVFGNFLDSLSDRSSRFCGAHCHP